jgi:glycosyltransferase involved in cell wall biosynthesis
MELRRLRELIRILRAERPHIVQGEQYDAGAYARIAAILAGVPIRMLAVRSAYPALRPRYRWLESILKRFTSAYLVNARAIKERTLAFHGVAPEKVHVIYNAYDPAKAPTRPPAEIRRGLGLGEDALVIGIVATFSPEKNHTLFLEFAHRIIPRHPNARFLLIGDGSERGGIETAIERLGIGGRVRLLGMRTDVRDLLSVLDVSVNTSVREGLNNALLESIAAGVPCLASRVGGTPELVTPGVHGELFDVMSLDDMVAKFEKMDGRLDEYRRSIREGRDAFLPRFDGDRIVEQEHALFQKLLDEKKIKVEIRAGSAVAPK